jgi:hypothetical protein
MSSNAAPTVTGALWIALLKFCSGDWNVPAADLDRLVEHQLVRKKNGVVELTGRGRAALGLPQ